MEKYRKLIDIYRNMDGLDGSAEIIICITIVLGILSLLYFGYLGVAKKRTFLMIRQGDTAGLGTAKFWVEGRWAVVLGISYLLSSILAILVAGPLVLIAMGLL